ncbi:hypothetical protein [Thermaerobacillus caldiproteolyticus]|uniref:Uncharacterized protein n=1 Tax=Thermaerobacillus caldiproteolyticus TaxID=247480 RepID=A0A7V9Z8V5_9BACL|nr:hypothetical protein [Anoxybacillus caldiproteolyticus]MBA2876207.1 hypothetical protein [Anoxybacillus caldiproteolyticus]QPA32562.1 hypothetical protein ISX45_06350 [Anoxybacillus caldiproteolyticus]
MKQKKWGAGGLVFVGCMFLGGGLGAWLGSPQIGWLIGMGVGFLGMALTRLMGK